MLLKILKIGFIAAFFVVSLSAQPGNERRRMQILIDAILEKISETDKLIAEKPADATLYAQRGGHYIELYRLVYRSDLSSYFGEKPTELSVPVIASKAIADFSKALNISPQAEWFSQRGEMFALRWNDFVSKFDWTNEIQNLEPVEWRDLISWQKPEPEKTMKIFGQFLQNPDFHSALSDSEKVLSLTEDKTLSEKAHQNIAKIYMRRAWHIFTGLEADKNFPVEKNQFGYSIFADIDTALRHISSSNIGNKFRRSYSDYYFSDPPVTLRYTLFDKAVIAARLGKNDLAIAALNEAEKYVDKTEKDDRFICEFYPLRSSLYAKTGKFDAAIADANVKFPNNYDPNMICVAAYEPRGDAFFGKGDFAAAIADYTLGIKEIYAYQNPSLFKKRGIAYLKIGETKKAADDFTSFLANGGDNLEGYRLRAQVFRLLGDETKAADDENRARIIVENNERMAIKRAVYGKIIMPDGIALDTEKLFVYASYVGKPSLKQSTSVDEQGRFLLTSLSPGDFRLFAYIDEKKGETAVRFYGLSDKLNLEDKLFGPIILKLDRSVKLAKQPANQ